MIFLILALVTSGAGVALSSPVSRAGLVGAGTGFASGYRASVRADRSARKVARTTAKAKKIAHWKSKESGLGGSLTWLAYRSGSVMVRPVRVRAKAVRSGLRSMPAGYRTATRKVRAEKFAATLPAGFHPEPGDLGAHGPRKPNKFQAAKSLLATREWKKNQAAAEKTAKTNTPEIVDPLGPLETESDNTMMKTSEFTDASQVRSAANDFKETLDGIKGQLASLATNVADWEDGSILLDQASEELKAALRGLDSATEALNSMVNAATTILTSGEAVAAAGMKSTARVGAMTAS
jgi:hypothetical protein